LRRSAEGEPLAVVGRHLVARLPVYGDPADVGREDTGLPLDVRTDVPGVGTEGKERRVADVVDVLHPFVLGLYGCLDAVKMALAYVDETVGDPIDAARSI
jgi:hypothetical protein